jgi:hypothetical protein
VEPLWYLSTIAGEACTLRLPLTEVGCINDALYHSFLRKLMGNANVVETKQHWCQVPTTQQ